MLCDGASIETGVCFITHYSLKGYLVLGPDGKLCQFLFHTINLCNCLCPLVLELQLQPGVLELRNEVHWQNYVGKLSQLLALLPDLELCDSFAENSYLSCELPVCQGLLFLARKEGKK